jgi:hypothetical protein
MSGHSHQLFCPVSGTSLFKKKDVDEIGRYVTMCHPGNAIPNTT